MGTIGGFDQGIQFRYWIHARSGLGPFWLNTKVYSLIFSNIWILAAIVITKGSLSVKWVQVHIFKRKKPGRILDLSYRDSTCQHGIAMLAWHVIMIIH